MVSIATGSAPASATAAATTDRSGSAFHESSPTVSPGSTQRKRRTMLSAPLRSERASISISCSMVPASAPLVARRTPGTEAPTGRKGRAAARAKARAQQAQRLAMASGISARSSAASGPS